MLLNHLIRRDTVYLHRDKPFSGVGFEVGEGQLVRSYQFENGLRIGDYHPLCAQGAEVNLQLDLSAGIDPPGLILYNAKPYTGVGYTFDNTGFCDFECFFKNGVAESELTWQKDGLMIDCNLAGDNFFGEHYMWYPNGKLKKFSISTNHSFVGGLSFTEQGFLRFVHLSRGFLKNLGNIRSEVKLRPIQIPIERMEDLANFKGADEVILFGDEVDDQLLALLATGDLLSGTKKVEIDYADGLTSLLALANGHAPNLRQVVLDNIKPEHFSMAQELKRARPALRIEFNRSPVQA